MSLPIEDCANTPASEEWRSYFDGFEKIVLVANSGSTDIGEIERRCGKDCLYIFFNSVFKVLSEPFLHGPSLLVTRSAADGANIVRRRHVPEVLSYLEGERFQGIVNVCVDPSERFSPLSDFGYSQVAFLDLTAWAATAYPAGHTPSTGYALAHWLVHIGVGVPIVLAGFSKTRTADFDWIMYRGHDWFFEQVMEQAFVESGKLARFEGDDPRSAAFARACREFPFISEAQIARIAGQVNENRLDNVLSFVDILWKSTRVSRWLRDRRRSLRGRLLGRRQS